MLPPKVKQMKEIANNSKMNKFIDISYKQNGECLKKIIKEGQGDEYPKENSFVSVNYSAKLVDGTVISSNSGEPFKFTLSKGIFIKGWEVGISTMKKKEIAVFHMKSKYVFEKRAMYQNIPSDATIIFEIELLDWEGERIGPVGDEEGIIRTVIDSGCEIVSPEINSIVEVKYIGKCNGNVFDEKQLVFMLGMGAEYNIPEGFERALQKFLLKEKSRVVMKPLYAFGETGCPELGIPPNSTVEYTIELLSIESVKPLWLMSPQDCIEQASLYKLMANDFFKKGKFEVAFRFYKNSLKYLDCKEMIFDKDDKIYMKKMQDLYVIMNSNLAQCCLKMNNYFEGKKFANNALNYDKNNVKALFRRGQAAYHLGEFESAKKDFSNVLQIEPNNAFVKNQLILCNKKLKEFQQKEMSLYSNMFKKMFLYKEKVCSLIFVVYFNKIKIFKEEEIEPNEEVMSKLGYWGESDRDRSPSGFEQENPNILVLNRDDTFENM